MNFSAVFRILGWILKFEAMFLTLPCIVALIYGEKSGFAFLITLALCLVVGIPLGLLKQRGDFFAKEGFVTVALSWIILSIFGALPFWLSGEIPSYTNALFETISGFTTTGASILADVEVLSHCCLFWRSFSHWIGGMGVLVFILAILPLAGGQSMHLMRAESPGPQVGKLVPKIRATALILYGIYFAMTVVEIVILICGGMPVFDSFTIAFGTAGTGGFGVKNSSIGEYSSFLQSVITVFMVLFGVNFNVYYLFLVKKPIQALKSEELRYYLGIYTVSALLIAWNIRGMFGSVSEAIHHSFFQVASIMTTTGYATTDFNLWPSGSKTILLMLMFVGACAGSTGGGIKVSRILILLKSVKRELAGFIHPRMVKQTRIEGRVLDPQVRSSVGVFLVAYLVIFCGSFLIVSIDNFDLETNFSAVAATLNNIGPGFSVVGATGNFSGFSILSKYVLMFDMLAGRLEVFPMLLLLKLGTWKR